MLKYVSGLHLLLASYSRLKLSTDYSNQKCGFLKIVRNRQTMVSLKSSLVGELNTAIRFRISLVVAELFPFKAKHRLQ